MPLVCWKRQFFETQYSDWPNATKVLMSDPVYLVSAIALSVSIVFALANHIQLIALQYMNVRGGTLVIVAAGFGVLLVLAPIYLEPSSLMSPAIGWFALGGLIVPALSMTLHTWSIRLLSPAITSALTSTSPVFAIVLAFVLLGELASVDQLLGTAIVIGSIAFIALQSRQIRSSWPLWALIIPLGAAACRAISHNVVKVGLNDLPAPMTAALVSSLVSLIVLGAWQGIRGHKMPRWNRGYWWFGLAGLLNAVGLVGLNQALELGTVTLVAPLVSTTPAFTLVLGWLFFRKEAVSWQTIVAMGAIFVGCLLIILR